MRIVVFARFCGWGGLSLPFAMLEPRNVLSWQGGSAPHAGWQSGIKTIVTIVFTKVLCGDA
ncbi:hypothetical protein GCM10009504_41080 [Pseudomonas laurentiana]|nr:hypothetical protein GCM10009504_41080 [Pseudomonas laurentiana]